MNQLKRLLILDNDERESAALGQLANTLGYEVDCTWSGREALAHLASDRFDFLWVDHYVADMYVGELLESALQLPKRPQIVLMKGPRARPIKYRKMLGQCQVIDKAQIDRLLQTLGAESLGSAKPNEDSMGTQDSKTVLSKNHASRAMELFS
jgi:two-component system cell cycle response regulator CpdR